jgi:hypothetical protein
MATMGRAGIECDSTVETPTLPNSQGAIFTAPFDQVSPEEIVAEVRRTGFWAMEGALAAPYVDQLLGEIDFRRYLVNSNGMDVVCASTQRFLSHCLAASKKAYDIITARKFLDICQAYFGGPFKLTNQRIYQTHSEGHMPWHTDNNCQAGSELTGKHQLPGLLFLIYLSDVTENPFQLLRNSQDWSKAYTGNYFSDEFIDEKYGQDIASFPAVRGTLFVCDIHTVHRAAPFRNGQYERFTLLFQVDAVSDQYPGHGERLFVNTAFIEDRDPLLLDYLGFGKPATYPTFPQTSVATLSVSDLLAMQKSLMPMALRALFKSTLKALIPGGLLVNLKRLKWRLRHGSESPKAEAQSAADKYS